MKINSWRELEAYQHAKDVQSHATSIGRQLGSMINKHETLCF